MVWAVANATRDSGGLGPPQKFDEAGQRDPEAHSANDELKHIHMAKTSERRSLRHIEKSERAENERDENTRRDVPIFVAHAGLLEWRHLTCRITSRSSDG